MAILDKFEAQVFVDGVLAQEYDNEDTVSDNPNEVIKYIEAISGGYFEVRFYAENNYQFTTEEAICFDVHVDGESFAGKIFDREYFRTQAAPHIGRRCKARVRGQKREDSDGLKLYQFQFADLETGDMEKADDIATLKKMYSDLGTIKISVWRVDRTGTTHSAPARVPKSTEPVPEKALKGRPIDITTRLTPVATKHASKHISRKNLDRKPIAKFTFKYRSRRALQSLMILERSPTPVPLEERPIEELTREEMTELLRRQKEQLQATKREQAVTKAEPDDTALDKKPKRPLKSSVGGNGETIYELDSDDDDSDIEEVVKPERKRVKNEVVELAA